MNFAAFNQSKIFCCGFAVGGIFLTGVFGLVSNIVAKDNLGANAGLIVGASLLIEYI